MHIVNTFFRFFHTDNIVIYVGRRYSVGIRIVANFYNKLFILCMCGSACIHIACAIKYNSLIRIYNSTYCIIGIII